MKLLASLFVSALDVEEEFLNELKRRFPFGVKGAAFAVDSVVEDPRMQGVISYLEQNGLRKRDYTRPGANQPGEYTYDVRRVYEKPDFDSAKYLRLVHSSKLSDEQKRDSEGRLILEAWRLTSELRMGCVLFEAAVVSDKLRQTIEKEGFLGVAFRPLHLIPAGEVMDIRNSKGDVRRVTPQDQDHLEKEGQFWELTSSIVLPPIEPARLLNRESQPFTGDYSRGVWLKDEFPPPELHYRDSALSKGEPFDFALTFENIPEEQWPVVSQRFRQFCIREKLKTDWFPVRVDP